tara:strand:+ start:145 stop:465 length:321 start_codon:yes stop_codon:yes gene_type:complete
MKLAELAKKPQLLKIELDDKVIVERYGEAVEFWIYDRYDMETYMSLLNSDDHDIVKLSRIIGGMVMNEDGSKVITDGEVLPSDLLMKTVEEVVKHLGNSLAQTSKK